MPFGQVQWKDSLERKHSKWLYTVYERIELRSHPTILFYLFVTGSYHPLLHVFWWLYIFKKSVIRNIQRRLRLKTIEHLVEQFSASSASEREDVKMKQAYDEDVRHEMEESEMREREMRRKTTEEREKEEMEQKRREEEIKKVVSVSSCCL